MLHRNKRKRQARITTNWPLFPKTIFLKLCGKPLSLTEEGKRKKPWQMVCLYWIGMESLIER
jgi:hypothetical protein